MSTTNGVSSDVIRTSLCHALSPSNLSSHDSMKNIFDHFSVMEDVEDGELLSDSEEETGNDDSAGTYKLLQTIANYQAQISNRGRLGLGQ